MFAIFPALIVLVAGLDVLGLVDPIIREALERIATLPSDSPWQVLVDPLERLATGGTPAGPMLWWSGSCPGRCQHIGAYQWAVGVIRAARGDRSVLWRQLSCSVLLAFIAYCVMLGAHSSCGGLGAADRARGRGRGPRRRRAAALGVGALPSALPGGSVLFAVFWCAAPGARRRHFGISRPAASWPCSRGWS